MVCATCGEAQVLDVNDDLPEALCVVQAKQNVARFTGPVTRHLYRQRVDEGECLVCDQRDALELAKLGIVDVVRMPGDPPLQSSLEASQDESVE